MTTLRFHGAAVLLLPLALFVAVTARLFISEAAFDLTGLAAAGVLTLFSGSLFAKAPSEYWKAAVRGASSELTGTVVLILIASGIFSAMMKASGVADGLVFLGGMLHLTGHAFTVFVLLASSLMAAATGSSIGARAPSSRAPSSATTSRPSPTSPSSRRSPSAFATARPPTSQASCAPGFPTR